MPRNTGTDWGTGEEGPNHNPALHTDAIKSGLKPGDKVVLTIRDYYSPTIREGAIGTFVRHEEGIFFNRPYAIVSVGGKEYRSYLWRWKKVEVQND